MCIRDRDTTDKKEIEQDEKYNLVQAAKLLASNKYYMMICVTYILQQIYGAMISMGTYYATYILGNQNLFGVFSWAINIPPVSYTHLWDMDTATFYMVKYDRSH